MRLPWRRPPRVDPLARGLDPAMPVGATTTLEIMPAVDVAIRRWRLRLACEANLATEAMETLTLEEAERWPGRDGEQPVWVLRVVIDGHTFEWVEALTGDMTTRDGVWQARRTALGRMIDALQWAMSPWREMTWEEIAWAESLEAA